MGQRGFLWNRGSIARQPYEAGATVRNFVGGFKRSYQRGLFGLP